MVNQRFISFFTNHYRWLLLLLIAVIARILFIEHQGLSNDELSAWIRTKPSTWNEFWYFGVSQGDMHPVFYQALLWVWVRLFGDSEWSIRLTALIFFVANMSLIYRICIRYFTKYAGEIITAIYAGSAFLIVNTSMARPYSSGLFFILLSFLTILKMKEKSKTHAVGIESIVSLKSPIYIGLVLTLCLGFIGAMTSHYFAFITVGILGLVSFFTFKSIRIALFIAGSLALALFALHLDVTLIQLGKGGLGWLSESSFFWWFDFSVLVFQDNLLFLLAFVVALMLIKKYKDAANPLVTYVGYFVVTLMVFSYLVSITYTPILRDLVFQFILPFILIAVLGRFKNQKSVLLSMFPFVIAIVLMADSFLRIKVTKPVSYGVFKEIADDKGKIDNEFGETNISSAYNFNNVGYLNYYLDKNAKESIIDWTTLKVPGILYNRAAESKKQNFFYAYSNNFTVPIYEEAIRRHFPYLRVKNEYFNSGDFLFSKSKGKSIRQSLLRKTIPMEKKSDNSEFMATFEIGIDELNKTQPGFVYWLLEAVVTSDSDEPLYWVQVANREGEMLKNGENPIFYQAYDMQQQSINNKNIIFSAFVLPKSLKNSDILSVYLWNPSKLNVTYNKVKLYEVIDTP